ncbi:MAG: phosphomannomutase/phosphoglucomutase [Patescibacteria group bacterium]|nr:phosphomannomutase/phosphoglucomutase [Patescibacteria group bacterium]
MKFHKDIFKAYDIRGLTPAELNPGVAYAIGRAFADFVPKGKVAVGRDMRTDSGELADAIIAGLIKQGREVIDLGQITSDMIYFAVGKFKLAGGAMITASHNPGQYDGIKLTGQGVVPIGIDSGLLEIEENISKDNYKKLHKKGSITAQNITQDWVRHALSIVGKIDKPLHIGTDTGNGMAAIVLPYLHNLTPLKIESLFVELDGTFPNHVANPLIEANTKDLRKLVVKKGLACGIAFDGDGDRAFVVDNKGELLSGSVLSSILAKDILEKNPAETVLYNVICSDIVPATIEGFGGNSVRTRVGHSFIKAQMKKRKAIFACEHSGHFYFRDNYNADSGLIAALMLLKILSKTDKSLSEIAAPFKTMFANSPELNFSAQDPAETIKVLERRYGDGEIDHLDGLTVRYRDWWFNARPSNTEPYLRLNIEARDKALLAEKLKKLKKDIGSKPI